MDPLPSPPSAMGVATYRSGRYGGLQGMTRDARVAALKAC
jgi:hypothetical protein